MSRHLPNSLIPLAALVACDTPSTSPTATLVFPSAVASGDQICFAVRVTDAAGESVFARGTPGMKPESLDEALAGGAVCGGVEGLSVEARCALGPSEARVWFVGVYDDGLRLEESYIDPCGEAGCAESFECQDVDAPAVEFEFSLMRESQQGFFDLSVLNADAPEGVSGICYAVRVRNADGAVVVSSREICSDDYGNGRGGDFTYIVPCDAESPEHDITVWVYPPEGSRVHETPCPAPAIGELDVWDGGCAQIHTCVLNQDVTVEFDFETEAP
ncbi:MAG TPA: hypothetical protein PK095_00320 [Myxococcota bacterium]|nr:hypothetical protein [Myxococcota bacterium]